MASPGIYPPPPQRHSVIGPLLLIAVGVLFLMRNFGFALPHWDLLVRYWPVLLIVIGLVRLAEFSVARNQQRPAPRLGGWTVFLLICFILGGLGLSTAMRANRDWFNSDRTPGWMRLFGSEFNFDGETSQALPPGASSYAIRLTCEHGDVSVKSWDQPEVKVVYHKRIFAGSQSEADALDRSTNPRLQMQGSTLVIDTPGDGSGPRSTTVDVEIYAPPKADLDLTARRGDVAIDLRTGQVKVNSQRGDVQVEQVTGNVSVAMHKGSLRATNLTGNISVDGRLDDLTLEEITGAATVAAEIFGDTHFSRLARGVTLRTSRTDLQIAKLDGELSMDSGDLQAESAEGNFSLTTRSKDVTLRDIKGDVKVSNDRGDITFESASQSRFGNLDLNTHHGDLHLRLPAKASFQLQASTRRGSFDSDFDSLRPQAHSDNAPHSDSATVNATVGQGGVKIALNSDTGDIQVMKSDSSISAPPAPSAPPKPPKPPKMPKTKADDTDVF